MLNTVYYATKILLIKLPFWTSYIYNWQRNIDYVSQFIRALLIYAFKTTCLQRKNNVTHWNTSISPFFNQYQFNTNHVVPGQQLLQKSGFLRLNGFYDEGVVVSDEEKWPGCSWVAQLDEGGRTEGHLRDWYIKSISWNYFCNIILKRPLKKLSQL